VPGGQPGRRPPPAIASRRRALSVISRVRHPPSYRFLSIKTV
jgi:hypothetical protein